MSHSRIFDEYAKIMSDKGLIKTADKKDEDYNTVPEKAGPDTKVEKSGNELVEIAHPEQIQVAESRLNDGIVENGVEMQRTMIDVALRNPRGVLASVIMKTLVKAANALDKEMTEESLKIAKEIDNFLFSLAQAKMPEVPNMIGGQGAGASGQDYAGSMAGGAGLGMTAVAPEAAAYGLSTLVMGGALIPGIGWIMAGGAVAGALGGWLAAHHREISGLYEGFEKAADYLGDLDYGSWYQLTSGTPQGKQLQKIINQLEGYAKIKENLTFDDPNYNITLLKKTFEGVQYVINMTPAIERAIESATDAGSDKEEASQIWNGLLKQCQIWLSANSKDLQEKGIITNKAPAGQDVANKAPGQAAPAGNPKAPSAHHYSATGDDVKELQKLLGLTGTAVDGKFGPNTFAALTSAAKNNSLVSQLMSNMPKSYQGWKNENIGEAINRLKTGAASAAQAKAPQQSEILTPYQSYEEGYQGATQKPLKE